MQEVWNRAIFAEHYQFSEQVMMGMLTTDIVHLSYFGYLGLVSSLMKSLLNKWKALLRLFGKQVWIHNNMHWQSYQNSKLKHQHHNWHL